MITKDIHSLGLMASHAASLSGEAGAVKIAFSSNSIVEIDTNGITCQDLTSHKIALQGSLDLTVRSKSP